MARHNSLDPCSAERLTIPIPGRFSTGKVNGCTREIEYQSIALVNIRAARQNPLDACRLR